jgi:hypothetical protein
MVQTVAPILVKHNGSITEPAVPWAGRNLNANVPVLHWKTRADGEPGTSWRSLRSADR